MIPRPDDLLTYFRAPNGVLLFALLLLFSIRPFVDEVPGLIPIIHVLVTLMMIAAVFACWSDRWIFAAAVVFGVVSQSLMLVGHFGRITAAGMTGNAIQTIFLLLIIFSFLRGIAKSTRVTMNQVFAAASAYLLMALAWGTLFEMIHLAEPGSFRGLAETTDATDMRVQGQLLYFSMITLTTVGYGDITPVSAAARTFAALEGLIGQLFLAIIIARLVGLEIAGRLEDRDASAP